MDIEKQYDKIGPEYIKGQNEYFNNKEDHARRFIKKCLPSLKNKRILDLGCGDGRDILTYEKLEAKEIYGIDSSTFMISEAKKIVKAPKNLVVGSMDSLPFKNKFFDLIIARFSIHYLSNLDKMYSEINRVLKNKGTFIVVAHHPTLGFMQLGGKDYNSKDMINFSLYSNKVNIKFHHHTLKDYFSETFSKFFIIDLLEEEPLENPEYPNRWNIPGFIAFKAIKRS